MGKHSAISFFSMTNTLENQSLMKMQLREEYYLDGVECDPFSFDPKDRDECGLTGEKAQQSKAYAGKVKLSNLQNMAKNGQ